MIRNLITISLMLLAMMTAVFATEDTSMVAPAVGDKAPQFTATDDNGRDFDSQAVLDKHNLVIYFYPAAMTGGCTAQACAFRDDQAKFEKLNTIVVGVSGDSIQNLVLFKKENNLNFPLLADPDGSIAKKFGVPLRDGGEIVRTVDDNELTLVRGVTQSRWTFIIDQSGSIIYKDTDVDAGQDSENVLAFLQSRSK